MRHRPIEPGENAGERTRKIRHAVGNDRKAVSREPGGIAIGVEDDGGGRRPQPRDHPVENGGAADGDQRLVTAAHAAREAAGKDEAEGRGMRCG